jgi:hypothetical protein
MELHAPAEIKSELIFAWALNPKSGQKFSREKIKTRKFSLLSNELFQNPGVFQLFVRFFTSLQGVGIKSVATQMPAKNRTQKTFFRKTPFFVTE